MNIKTFQELGISFTYSRYTGVPQIPRVQDVLFALRLSLAEENYTFCQANHEPYVTNVHRAAVAVSFEVMAMWSADEAMARKAIAEAILDLCPPEAKCLFNNAFFEAQEIYLGKKSALSRTASYDAILYACTCPQCRVIIRQRSYYTD